MMNGPIRRMGRSRVEARSDVRLPTAWVGGTARSLASVTGTWVTRGPTATLASGDGPMLVVLGEGAADARAELLAHAATGARVYALVGPTWGKSDVDTEVLQAPRVLLRRVSEVPASGVHAGAVAKVWIGGGFALQLDEHQAEALRQTFLRLFWHEATEEAWSGGMQFAWRAASERPFDVPEVPASAAVRWEGADARLGGAARGALMHLTSGLPPDAAPRRLWFAAGREHHERLARLAHAGAEVLWDDRGLPDLLVAGSAGEMLLPGVQGRLRLRLTANQAAEVARLLEGDGAWRFHTDVRLGDPNHLAAKFWLSGEDAPRVLETEQLIEVPEVHATSLRAVPDAAPASVPPAQPLALTAHYKWMVVPPRVPSGADEDALVGRWRKLDQDWSQHLARVRETLVSAEGDRGRIGRAFSRLLSATLGFERTHSQLLARAAELGAKLPSREGPHGARTLYSQLLEIEAAAKELHVNQQDAERVAREDEERERQKAEWEGQVAQARDDVRQLRKEVAEAEGRESELAQDAQEIAAHETHATPAKLKDLDARKKRNSDDRTNHEKNLKKIRYNLEKREKDAARPFAFVPPKSEVRPPKPSGARFVPTSAGQQSTPAVPDDALPEVGMLLSQKGQRYLVIQTWEELDAGEQAATRLSAQLVAPEDA